MTDAEEVVGLLRRRSEVLRSLVDAPKERHEVVDEFDEAASTVYEGLAQFQERGLVTSTADGLRPTLFGVVALERYDELVRTADFGEVLADLPPGTVDPSALVGADAVLPDRRAVDRPLVRLEEILRDAGSIRGFAPAVSPRMGALFHDRIVDDGIPVEIVLPSDIVESLHREHQTTFEETVSAPSATYFRTDEALPFTLLLVSSSAGTQVCIDVEEAGLVTGLVVNDTAESRRWAEAAYERRKGRAELLTPDGLRGE